MFPKQIHACYKKLLLKHKPKGLMNRCKHNYLLINGTIDLSIYSHQMENVSQRPLKNETLRQAVLSHFQITTCFQTV